MSVVTVELHGASAAAHDYHTGEAGSFARAIAAIDEARDRGLEVRVDTWLTRSSFRGLSEMIPLLRARGIAEWRIDVPIVEETFERLAPRLALSLPYALHAIDRARKLGLPASLRGAPLCLLGPHAHFAVISDPRAYATACEGCRARSRCPGVQQAYLDRFGGDELTRAAGRRASRGPTER